MKNCMFVSLKQVRVLTLFSAMFVVAGFVERQSHADGWERRNNDKEQQNALRTKHQFVYFGHRETLENALKYTRQYMTGDWYSATAEIAKVINSDVQGLRKS